jgi:hypothetical protein
MAKGSQARRTLSPETTATERLDPSSPVEAAAYIFQMTGELAAMARSFELADLAYLLEMAKLEAGNPSRKAIKKAS